MYAQVDLLLGSENEELVLGQPVPYKIIGHRKVNRGGRLDTEYDLQFEGYEADVDERFTASQLMRDPEGQRQIAEYEARERAKSEAANLGRAPPATQEEDSQAYNEWQHPQPWTQDPAGLGGFSEPQRGARPDQPLPRGPPHPPHPIAPGQPFGGPQPQPPRPNPGPPAASNPDPGPSHGHPSSAQPGGPLGDLYQRVQRPRPAQVSFFLQEPESRMTPPGPEPWGRSLVGPTPKARTCPRLAHVTGGVRVSPPEELREAAGAAERGVRAGPPRGGGGPLDGLVKQSCLVYGKGGYGFPGPSGNRAGAAAATGPSDAAVPPCAPADSTIPRISPVAPPTAAAPAAAGGGSGGGGREGSQGSEGSGRAAGRAAGRQHSRSPVRRRLYPEADAGLIVEDSDDSRPVKRPRVHENRPGEQPRMGQMFSLAACRILGTIWQQAGPGEEVWSLLKWKNGAR